jgi:hypothetical protein
MHYPTAAVLRELEAIDSLAPERERLAAEQQAARQVARAANIRVELARLRKQIENPTGKRWSKYDEVEAVRKHTKLVQRAKLLSTELYQLTGEEA